MLKAGNNKKRSTGRYYTAVSPFEHAGFLAWATECKLPQQTVLEPFAGRNSLIHMLQAMQLPGMPLQTQPLQAPPFQSSPLCGHFQAYDIDPQDPQVQLGDSLQNFPTGFEVCITNPPYLASNSAKRRGLFFPNTQYDDLYKLALEKCLQHCSFVAAIIPASFLNARLFRDRLSDYILLNTPMFNDTEHPVCLALFKPQPTNTRVYQSQKYVGLLNELEAGLPKTKKKQLAMQFNNPTGKLGLIAIDNTQKASICFCDGAKIDSNRVRHSSRSITRIAIDCDVPKLLQGLNERLNTFRTETSDMLLTPFKGLRKDMQYRRRLDFALARRMINEVCSA